MLPLCQVPLPELDASCAELRCPIIEVACRARLLLRGKIVAKHYRCGTNQLHVDTVLIEQCDPVLRVPQLAPDRAVRLTVKHDETPIVFTDFQIGKRFTKFGTFVIIEARKKMAMDIDH